LNDGHLNLFPQCIWQYLRWNSDARQEVERLYKSPIPDLPYTPTLAALPRHTLEEGLIDGFQTADVIRIARTSWPLKLNKSPRLDPEEGFYGIRYFEVFFSGPAAAEGEVLGLGLVTESSITWTRHFRSLFADDANRCRDLWSLTLYSPGGAFVEGAFLSAGANETDLEAAGIDGFWHRAPNWSPSMLHSGDTIGLAVLDVLPTSLPEARSVPHHSILAFVHNSEIVTACALNVVEGVQVPHYAARVDAEVYVVAELPFADNTSVHISTRDYLPSAAAILAALET